MLRIGFGAADLNRLRLVGDGELLWDAVLSLEVLRGRRADAAFDPWRRQVGSDLLRLGLLGVTHTLLRLGPRVWRLPALLGPHASGASGASGAPEEAPSVSGEALRRYHAVAVAPYRRAIRAAVAADRRGRLDAFLRGGAEALVASFRPTLAWHGDHLACACPVDQEVFLRGRPLTLVPSFFCTRWPVAIADPEQPPVLLYPLRPRAPVPGWPAPSEHPGERAVGRLLGATRAQVLDLLERPQSTEGIAAALHLSPASASRHAAVLRSAGLVSSRREGHLMLHRRTELGEALLAGDESGGGALPQAPPPLGAAAD